MTKKLMVLVTMLGFSSGLAWADKPEWAGQGGKPTDQQIEDHRNEMRDKNNDKPGKDVEQGKKDEEDEKGEKGEKGEKDQNSKMSRYQQKDKSKGEGNDSRGRDYSDRDEED